MAVGVNIVSQFDSSGIKKAITDFKKLEGAGAKSTYALRTFDKAMTNGLVNLGKFAAGVGVAAGAIGYKLASAAYESQKVMAQTTQIIAATGGAANVTASQVEKLSQKLSMQIGVDDELIQKSANLLLTFKQVQNQVGLNNNIFDRAVIAAQDLGSVFGSADAAAMQLGKALSDPEKGITALRRAGINFTEQQKAQIKTLVESGDVLGAQKLILAEVESQVGGTAAASATGFERMQVALGNVAEEFGAQLIPYIERFANFVIEKVVPYLSNLSAVIGKEGVAGAIKTLATDFVGLIENGGKFTNILLGLVAAFTAIRLVTIAATISQSLFNVALFANPIGITVAAVIAFGVALAALYLKFKPVRDAVNAFGKALMYAFQWVAEKVINFFIGAINGVIDVLNACIWVANKLGADIEPIGKIGKVAFGELGDAAHGAAVDINQVRAQFQGLREDRNLSPVYRQVQSVTRATKDLKDETTGAGAATKTAQQELQEYIDALKGVSSAQRAARDATKAVTNANLKAAAANTKLAEAQQYFQQVVSGYGAGSRQAMTQQQALAQAQRKVERSGYGVEQAVFAVAKAEEELAAIRLDPQASATAIREAEIALAEAKLNVQDATDSQTEATNELAAAESRLDEIINGAKEGSDAYREALDALNDAKREQAESVDAVTAALEREKEAIDAVREAEKKLKEERKDITAPQAARAEAQVNGIAPATGGSTGLFPSFMQAVQALHPNSRALDSATPVRAAKAQFPKLYETYKAAGLALAQGGIVTSPTTALIGEAGAEAVVPLDRLESGMNITVNINAGMGTDPAALGDEIVNVLQRYNRRNGALPLKVA
jgi:hypothetical protein